MVVIVAPTPFMNGVTTMSMIVVVERRANKPPNDTGIHPRGTVRSRVNMRVREIVIRIGRGLRAGEIDVEHHDRHAELRHVGA